MATTYTTQGRVVNLIRMTGRSNAGELQVLFVDDNGDRNMVLLVSIKLDRKQAMKDLKWDKRSSERKRAQVTILINETTNTKTLTAYKLL